MPDNRVKALFVKVALNLFYNMTQVAKEFNFYFYNYYYKPLSFLIFF